ncbi:MAG TPA: hypothetical protein VNH11_08380 [Pirellulales bacterium]|nr:hypothetical protein [Pirellulales bacterium]
MPRFDRPTPAPPGLQTWHWFVLAAAVPLIHCASRLNLDLWHDEIYTVDYFVRRGPAFIVTDYSLPNNHVLYSLLLWPFFCVSESNFVLRLPSLISTIGTLATVFLLAKRLRGITCAVLSTALLGLNQMFLIFTIQVRGYSLSMFLAAWLASLALANGAVTGWRRWAAVALVGGSLLYVLPTNALFFAPLATVAVVAARMRGAGGRELAGEAVSWLLAGLLALACYLPILSQVRKTAESSSPSSWSYLPVIAGNFLRPATHDLVWLAPLFLAGLVAWLLPRRDGLPRHGAVPALALAVAVGAFLITGLLRISPFERNYCPLLPLMALAEGWLLTELSEAVHRRWAGRRSAEAATAVALLAVSLVLWPQLWTYPQRLEAHRTQVGADDNNGYYCYYAANYRPSAVVQYLSDIGVVRSAYRVCYTEADHLNLFYYFARSQFPLFENYLHGVPTKDGVKLFAILPEPPPWRRLAADCRLTPEQVGTFRLIGDFGYYRLYQAAVPLNVGWPPDAIPPREPLDE